MEILATGKMFLLNKQAGLCVYIPFMHKTFLRNDVANWKNEATDKMFLRNKHKL